MINKIYHGDCLELLQDLDSNSIDLIYLDPPFFTQQTRSFIKSEYTFDDKFDSMDHYLYFIRSRIEECYRVLKKTGSFYLHCDWHASHYLKVLCDTIFGYKQFKSEVIWKYISPTNSRKNYPRQHDNILFYTKTNDYIFNHDEIRVPYRPSTILRADKIDGRGMRYKSYPGGRRAYPHPLGKPSDFFEIFFPSTAPERLGYPTQKPEALLERIIKTSSNLDDLVLDPFCGSGTTCAVAKRLQRNYIGMDSSQDAVALATHRLILIDRYKNIKKLFKKKVL